MQTEGCVMSDTGPNAGGPNNGSWQGDTWRSAGTPPRAHAFDPYAQPDLFRGVLMRRVVAFLIDLVVLSIPIVLAVYLHRGIRRRHPRPRLGAVLADLAGDGDLAGRLLRHVAGWPALGHRRYANDGSADAHLQRHAGLLRARRGAHAVLVLGLGVATHAAGAGGRPAQWPRVSCCTTSCWEPWW